MKKIFKFLSILLLISNGFFSQNALSQLISQQVTASESRWLGSRGIDCQRQPEGRAEQVRASQYCDFLNYVEATDLHHLYDNEIGSDPYAACIERIGTPGDYRYFVLAGKENFPITYVNFSNEARYCNWLNNGQLTSEQDSACTETGAYDLDKFSDATVDEQISKNATSKYFILEPNENDDGLLKSNQRGFAVVTTEVATVTLATSSTKSEPSNSWSDAQKTAKIVGAFVFAALLHNQMVTEGPSISSRLPVEASETDPLLSDVAMHEGRLIIPQQPTARDDERLSETEESCRENVRSLTIDRMDRINDLTSSPIESIKIDALPSKGILKREGKFGTATVVENKREGRPDSPTRFKSDAEEFFANAEEGLKKFGVVEGDKKTKTVSFNISPEAESSSELHPQSLRRKLSPEEKQLNKYDRQLSLIGSGIEIAIDDLSEPTPNEEASIYAKAYPKVNEYVKKIYSLIKSSDALQNKKEALLVARFTIETIKIASRTVAPENLDPIKEIPTVFAIKKSIKNIIEIKSQIAHRDDETFADILDLAQAGLETAETLVEILARRKIN